MVEQVAQAAAAVLAADQPHPVKVIPAVIMEQVAAAVAVARVALAAMPIQIPEQVARELTHFHLGQQLHRRA
jgi:hypothetical protein